LFEMPVNVKMLFFLFWLSLGRVFTKLPLPATVTTAPTTTLLPPTSTTILQLLYLSRLLRYYDYYATATTAIAGTAEELNYALTVRGGKKGVSVVAAEEGVFEIKIGDREFGGKGKVCHLDTRYAVISHHSQSCYWIARVAL
jgi:hypothetical protein